ncbi:uncharacterized protein LOC109835949 [Asparagus officinalis]|uniref:uncharacterized protein LOC109835949 n=1 Tax=Asparagus officinalis TaxID=4686 RepID=UPI00098DF2C6|nr:uncharacterized protein LOC109835949 [Asparagus officinalis]
MKTSTFLFSFLLILILANASIDDTCKQVADPKHYDFCISTLKSNSNAKTDDKRALASVVTDLTIEAYKKTQSRIEELKKNEAYNNDQQLALSLCEDLYKTSIPKLEQAKPKLQKAIPRYSKGGVAGTTKSLTTGMDHVSMCIDACNKSGAASLLEKENQECLNLVILASNLIERATRG